MEESKPPEIQNKVLPELSPAEKKKNEKMSALIKEVEQALFTIKFYPVAAKEDAKDQAFSRLKEIFTNEEETIRQLILYMVHENISQIAEMKNMHNFDFFKRKTPNLDSPQTRIQVYRAMFNFNHSIEGVVELIKFLGELDGDDAAKVLTYHFSFLASVEAESVHMLRNSVIDSLGNSNSAYAIKSLLIYARHTDNEKLLQRIAYSLVKWSGKIDSLKISKKEKDRIKESLNQVLTNEFGDSHYA